MHLTAYCIKQASKPVGVLYIGSGTCIGPQTIPGRKAGLLKSADTLQMATMCPKLRLTAATVSQQKAGEAGLLRPAEAGRAPGTASSLALPDIGLLLPCCMGCCCCCCCCSCTAGGCRDAGRDAVPGRPDDVPGRPEDVPGLAAPTSSTNIAGHQV